MTLAVTGASGQLGRIVIDELLNRTTPDRIVALVRDGSRVSDLAERGVQVRTFDYDRPDSLPGALEGVERLLLISGNAVGQRVPQHQAVIDAATAAGVQFFAYTSVLHADTAKLLPVVPEHVETEELLAGVPFPVALLRNGWYSENYLETAQQAAENGTLVTSAKDGKVFSATRADYAAAAAAVLAAETFESGVYELAGDTGWSLQELAQTVAELSGKPVNVENVSSEEHRTLLRETGLPDGLVDFLVVTDAAVADGELADPAPGTLSKLIGRPTTPLQETLAPLFRS